ncbi:glutathione S-transferase N-terminal domain-containing protein [Solirubrobacter sp. CPCC 204708]|uniref:Glutathione S-transferase N-terminal domain-containing protein n=1 Tax=Solirubrobacter deserti TaxID=2282478 RepID=A0ABT4RCQ0_9ACTN|nr:glutathione S-transferase N-terminal domain-containing protein [Solirubrobacter deserti]MBE2317903.1 glutathione S-transferase N-terminal domain-containing protein [Solirubrobacter deserti]MDA0136320.1 glutathione S-transferase N-terminal domain-containing protein [Solirubrobacter deserti]
MRARLVGVPGSHPVVSAELMLRHKGVEFTRLDLPNMTHKAILPLLRYRGSTVPVLTIDGRRASGTMRIARVLERLVPEPPMLIDDHGDEAWADSVLQDGVRQLARYAVGRDDAAMAEFLHRPLLGIPPHLVRRAVPVLQPLVRAQMRVKPATVQACLEALPGQLDRVDALLEAGTIGGARPNVVDFQVAPSVRLMLAFDQLRGHIDARPAGAHARRLVPDYPGRFRAVFPDAWLPF